MSSPWPKYLLCLKKRLNKLVADAKRSVASATDTETEQLIIATARQITHLNQTIDAQSQRMTNTCKLPEVELLKTFDGISDKSAIGLIIEIQTVERFATAKKLAVLLWCASGLQNQR